MGFGRVRISYELLSVSFGAPVAHQAGASGTNNSSPYQVYEQKGMTWSKTTPTETYRWTSRGV